MLAASPRPRLVFVDHLRVLLTVLVVAHHAAQAYGPTGGSWPVGEEPRSALLGVMISVNAMFFMGLFFFVSGYFTPGALARKGPRAFVVDRFLRFGVPCGLVLTLTATLRGRPEFLHLWFVIDLLALNLGYVAWVAWRRPPETVHHVPAPPGWLRIVLVIVLIGLGTAAIRLTYPIDRWTWLAWVLPVEPAHWVQYGALYGLGIWAARTNWLVRFSDQQGAWALLTALAAVAGFALYRLWPDKTVSWFSGGGWNVQNLNFALLESFVAVCLGLGLLWFFRKYLSRGCVPVENFAADAYGIYCVHLPLVVLMHVLLKPLPPAPLTKFLLATFFTVAVSWALTRLLLRSSVLGRRIF